MIDIDKLKSALEISTDHKILRDTVKHIPVRNEIIKIVKDLQSILFPSYFTGTYFSSESDYVLTDIYKRLSFQISTAYQFCCESVTDSDSVCDAFFAGLPYIKEALQKDISALYEGDPAAKCYEEVLLCYPGFYAISIYRMAHELYKLKVPLIPRIMTEYAHEKTGIDIHAGAEIGEYFFIDHGTGIVIGETTVIGHHVKLYQGVTLGARNFKLDPDGKPVKNIKRHPNIGNNVVIYANATILGGDTFIGDNSVIGGNTWLTSSVPEGSTVYYR